MQNKSIIFFKANLKFLLSIVLTISLVFSGSVTNLALANDVSDNNTSAVEGNFENNSDNALGDESSNSDSEFAVSKNQEAQDIDRADLSVANADPSNELPELKENSWRFKDGQRIDLDNSSVLPVLGAGMYNHSNVKAYGIDVSAWQGDIDWATAKNYIDFAIIRAGYGINYTGYDDNKWYRNVEMCERYGIPYGVYLYSYATDLDDANSEADHLLRLLSGHRPSYPVYIDMEEAKTLPAGRNMLINIASTVCERIKAAGYTPGVYANLNWWRNYLNDSRFDNYERWVAQYNYRCDYDGDYRIWQYSSKGSVPGIAGYVDMNYDYEEISESTYELVYNYDYYKNTYSDLRAAYGSNRQAYIRHFIRYGMPEGRQANPLFNPKEYKEIYNDLQNAFGDIMTLYYTHWIEYGCNENRRPKRGFDIASYFYANNDLRVAYGGNLRAYYMHYNNYGYFESRLCSGVTSIKGITTRYAGVDWSSVYDFNYYIDKNPDVKAVFKVATIDGHDLINDVAVLGHFYEWGIVEGRRGNSTFDIAVYYNAYDDLRSAFGVYPRLYYSHYCNYGKKEGRICSGNVKMRYRTAFDGVDYSPLYDGEFYTDRNRDVKEAFSFNLTRADRVVDDLLVLRHLLDYGMNEKRQPSANFNVETYKNRYGDLQAAYGSNWQAYYLHYIYYGVSENRSAI